MNSLSLNSNVYSPNKIYSDQIKQIKKLICAGIKTVFTVVCFLLLLNWNVNYSLSQRVPCILLCLIKLNNIFTSNLPVFLVFSFCRGGWCYSLCCCTSGNWGRDPTGNKMSFFWLPSAVVIGEVVYGAAWGSALGLAAVSAELDVRFTPVQLVVMTI